MATINLLDFCLFFLYVVRRPEARVSFERSHSTYRYTWNSFMSGALTAGAEAAAGAAAEAEAEETDGADAAALAEGGACAGGPEVVVRAARQRFVFVVEDVPTSLPRAAAVRAAASMARQKKVFSSSSSSSKWEEREEKE